MEERVGADGNAYMSHGSHAIVRCPQTWVPPYVNDGHECLVVRALEPMMDAVSPDQFSSAADRHVAQRNIAVAQAASPREAAVLRLRQRVDGQVVGGYTVVLVPTGVVP